MSENSGVGLHKFHCIYHQNMGIKRHLARFDQKSVLSLFFVYNFLPVSLIMHVPISELHAYWHFSMSLNSQHLFPFPFLYSG